jgi:hypothetical protein
MSSQSGYLYQDEQPRPKTGAQSVAETRRKVDSVLNEDVGVTLILAGIAALISVFIPAIVRNLVRGIANDNKYGQEQRNAEKLFRECIVLAEAGVTACIKQDANKVIIIFGQITDLYEKILAIGIEYHEVSRSKAIDFMNELRRVQYSLSRESFTQEHFDRLKEFFEVIIDPENTPKVDPLARLQTTPQQPSAQSNAQSIAETKRKVDSVLNEVAIATIAGIIAALLVGIGYLIKFGFFSAISKWRADHKVSVRVYEIFSTIQTTCKNIVVYCDTWIRTDTTAEVKRRLAGQIKDKLKHIVDLFSEFKKIIEPYTLPDKKAQFIEGFNSTISNLNKVINAEITSNEDIHAINRLVREINDEVTMALNHSADNER